MAEKKKPPLSSETKRGCLEPDHPHLSVRRQCDLLGLPRSSAYYQPVGESPENLALLRVLDEAYTKTPFYGSRRWSAWLTRHGQTVNRERVQRLLGVLGVQVL